MKIRSLALPLTLTLLALPGVARSQSFSGQSSGTVSIGNPYMLCFTDGVNLAQDACFTQGGNRQVKLLGTLNLSGGSLSANFFSSTSANPAQSGLLRLASGDSGGCWRNAANNADLCLSKNGSDVLLWPNAISAPSFTSTVSTGTAPFTVSSTTVVPNLNAALLNGATFAAPGAIGGTTPGSGAFTTISASGQITSTITTGTAPLVVASTTVVPNLNAQLHNGKTAPTGNIVGDSDAQTLSGKTITGPSGLLYSPTTPTITSGFGTSPSIGPGNGTATFNIAIGSGGTATSGVIGLPIAAFGWTCTATDVTTQSATVFVTKQISSGTNSATLANFNTSGAQAAWVANDILFVSCWGR